MKDFTEKERGQSPLTNPLCFGGGGGGGVEFVPNVPVDTHVQMRQV